MYWNINSRCTVLSTCVCSQFDDSCVESAFGAICDVAWNIGNTTTHIDNHFPIAAAAATATPLFSVNRRKIKSVL